MRLVSARVPSEVNTAIRGLLKGVVASVKETPITPVG